MTAKIITLSNKKGGSSKTTISRTLIQGLANRGYSVLGVDLDGQIDLTTGFYIEPNSDNSIYQVLTKRIKDIGEIIYNVEPNIDIAMGSEYIDTALDGALGKAADANWRLKMALKEAKEFYDYIIIDTPPAIGFPVFNALYASDALVIPTKPHKDWIKGVNKILEQYQDVVDAEINEKLKLAGILLTQVTKGTREGKIALSNAENKQIDKLYEIAEKNNTKIFDTILFASSKYLDALENNVNIFKSNTYKEQADAINHFIDELLEVI
jgi:chromosome partitioning protein